MKRLIGIIALCLLFVCCGTFESMALTLASGHQSRYDVRDYGAVANDEKLDTYAIQAAIQAASEAGGGQVYFPAGKFLSHSIQLKDHICLYLERGCILSAAPANAQADYDHAEENPWNQYQDFGHSHWKNSLIWGIGLQDISIEGSGLIDGTDGLTRGEGRMGEAISVANKAIALKLCRAVTLRDFSILMGGHFALLATGVDNLTIDNVKVDTNRDGFDIDACRQVRISNCHVNSLQDDAIVLKSSYALGFMRACENIVISNCCVTGYDPGSFFDGSFRQNQTLAPDREGPTGRIKIGTESNAGFTNISISNCVFERSRGIALETVDGACIENISINNVVMRNICNSVIFMRIGARMRAPEGTPYARMRQVNISNVVATDVDPRYSTLIAGLNGHPIEDVTLSNIRIQYRGGLSLETAAQQPKALVNPFFTRRDTSILAAREDPYAVPENEKIYPEPCTFGILPAYGMYIRHVKNIVIENVELGVEQEDTRPVFVLDDVDGATFRHIQAEKATTAPYFVLRKVRNFSIHQVNGLTDTSFTSISSTSL